MTFTTPRWRTLPLVLILICAHAGCAYFNAFYNARQLYDQAMDMKGRSKDSTPSAAVISLLDRSIEKCTKVLKDHPQSRWADDAVFLLGNCYFEKQDYEKAIRKYEEVVQYYPQSKWVRISLFSTGKCYLVKGDYPDAVAAFSRFLVSYPHDRLAPSAQMSKAAAFLESGDYGQAIKEFQGVLDQFPRAAIVPEARIKMAEARIQLADYPAALRDLHDLLVKTRLSSDLFLEASTELAQCFEATGSDSQALRAYEGILEQEDNPERLRSVELKIALTYEKLGQPTEATKRLEALPTKYPRTQEAAEAYYQAGLIYRDQGNLEKATEMLQKARSEYSGAKISAEALKQLDDLTHLKEYRDKLRATQDPEETAKTEFALAELYLFKLGEVDSALVTYGRVVSAHPTSDLAPKAEYALAWVQEGFKHDTTEARRLYAKVITDYPQSRYAAQARKILTVSISADTLQPDTLGTIPPDTTRTDTLPPPGIRQGP